MGLLDCKELAFARSCQTVSLLRICIFCFFVSPVLSDLNYFVRL